MSRGSAVKALLTGCILLTAACAAAPGTSRAPATVAVWDLEDLSPTGTSGYDLGELLAGAMIEKLQAACGLRVVTRERLLLALEELRLGSTALADENTRLRLGRIVGAQWMVFGGYQLIAGVVRLDARMVEVETGKVVRAARKTLSSGDLQDWLKAAGDAAAEMCAPR